MLEWPGGPVQTRRGGAGPLSPLLLGLLSAPGTSLPLGQAGCPHSPACGQPGQGHKPPGVSEMFQGIMLDQCQRHSLSGHPGLHPTPTACVLLPAGTPVHVGACEPPSLRLSTAPFLHEEVLDFHPLGL